MATIDRTDILQNKNLCAHFELSIIASFYDWVYGK